MPVAARARPEPTFWVRVLHAWNEHWWLLVAVAGIVALTLGYVGYEEYFRLHADPPDPRDPVSLLYHAIQLFSFQMSDSIHPAPLQLQIARFLAPLVTAATAIKALWPVIQGRVDAFVLRYRMHDHAIICGLGRKGLLFAQGFKDRGPVVVIERDPTNHLLSLCHEAGIKVVLGDATLVTTLEHAGVARARYLLAVTGDDGLNAETVLQARAVEREHRGSPLTARIHLVDPRLASLLGADAFGLGDTRPIRVELFNIYERAARVLLSETAELLASEDEPRGLSHQVLVFGSGPLAECLIEGAIRQWQPYFAQTGTPLRLTLVTHDATAASAVERIATSACQVSVRTPDAPSHRPEALADLVSDLDPAAIRAAYICLPDDSHTMQLGLLLNDRFPGAAFPRFLVFTNQMGLAGLVTNAPSGTGKMTGLHAFRLFEQTCTPEAVIEGSIERLAQGIHAAYLRALPPDGPRGPAAVPWEELDEMYRESSRQQADHLLVKLAAIHCGLAPKRPESAPFELTPPELERLARMEHTRWFTERRASGWKHGEVRDDSTKRHPDMVLWEALTPEAQEKDYNAVREIPKLLDSLGLTIQREL